MTLLGQITTTKPIENAVREIRDWLDRININGLDVNTRWDAKNNIALVQLKYKNANYEFRSTNQHNCRLNMYAIARVMEFKVRAHLMEIEKFDKSMQAYLAIENKSSYQNPFNQISADEKNYAVLGLNSLASNEEIKNAYKSLALSLIHI